MRKWASPSTRNTIFEILSVSLYSVANLVASVLIFLVGNALPLMIL